MSKTSYQHRPILDPTMPVQDNWEQKAACKGLDHDIMIPETQLRGRAPYTADKYIPKVCNDCPVKQDCYNTAKNNLHLVGVWGGRLWGATARPYASRLDQKVING